ncbi:MAG: extracellular solute-binding protein [Clostridia bacterium]|nr:extracellular solute-binding protein [Clostridia bacterium]
MKKLFAVLLSLLILGGCAADDAPAPEQEPVSLRVWVGDNADVPWMERVIADFQAANPEQTYSIQIGVQNEGDCAKVVLSDMEAAADVFTFADDQMTMLLKAGALMPVVEDADAVRSANTPESVSAASGADGQLYAYPATADNGYFLFYNTNYLNAEDVATFEGMLEKAAAANKRVAFPMSNGWYFYSWFKGAGLQMGLGVDGVTNVCNWNATDTPIKGSDVVTALLDIAAHPGFVEADSDAFIAGIKDGSIVAGVSGTWNASVAAESWGDSYAAAKLPTYRVAGQDVQMASFSGFKLVGVNAYSDHVGDAMDFARFMTGEAAQVLRFELRRQGPSNIAALSSPAVQAEPAIAAIVAQAPYATVQRVGSKYWDASAALGKIIVNGNPDNIDVQTLLDQCVAGITASAEQ